MDLPSDILAWLQGERTPQPRETVIKEIMHLAKYNDAWPRATKAEWNKAIDEAVNRGLIDEVEGVLSLAVVAEREVKQLELFT